MSEEEGEVLEYRKTTRRTKMVMKSGISRFTTYRLEKVFHQGVCTRLSQAKWYPGTPLNVRQSSWSAIGALSSISCRNSARSRMLLAQTGGFDTEGRKDYACCCPVKQRRATLGSDPLRDSRMRLRRIFRPGKPSNFPASFLQNIRSCLLCLKNPGGLGAEPPIIFDYIKIAKIHFTPNQYKMTTWIGLPSNCSRWSIRYSQGSWLCMARATHDKEERR